MKNSYCYALWLLSLFFNSGYSQPIILNSGFESWTTPNSPEIWKPTFDNEQIIRESDSHSGNYALKLQSKDKDGIYTSQRIENTTDIYPVSLKGFIKYAVPPGEKVLILVQASRKFESTNIFSDLGWAKFAGIVNIQ